MAFEKSFQDIFSENAVLLSVLLVVVTSLLIFSLVPRKKKLIALNPEVYIPFKLIDKEILTHDTRRFRFALQSENHVLGLPIGQHISLKASDKNGKMITRSYTPTSSDDEVGYVDFVIKVYFSGVHPKFPEGGAMSQYVEALNIGDSLEMRGPKGNLEYRGHGRFCIKRKGNTEVSTRTKIGMIAGGTGITPMLQIIKAVVKEKSNIELWLLFANQTEQDILVRKELEDLAMANSNLKLWYTLDRPPPTWSYSTGFINIDMLEDHLPPPSFDTIILMCGPPIMIEKCCIPNLVELGFKEQEQTFTF